MGMVWTFTQNGKKKRGKKKKKNEKHKNKNKNKKTGWLFKVELSNPEELKELMNEKEYEDFLKTA